MEEGREGRKVGNSLLCTGILCSLHIMLVFVMCTSTLSFFKYLPSCQLVECCICDVVFEHSKRKKSTESI